MKNSSENMEPYNKTTDFEGLVCSNFTRQGKISSKSIYPLHWNVSKITMLTIFQYHFVFTMGILSLLSTKTKTFKDSAWNAINFMDLSTLKNYKPNSK